MLLRHVYLLFACIWSLAIPAQTDAWLPADTMLHHWHRNHPEMDADALCAKADSLLQAATTCSEWLFGTNLMLRGWSLAPDLIPGDWRSVVTAHDTCPTPSARYHYQYAVMDYVDEQWLEAANGFWDALKLPGDSTFKQECHTNIAACLDKVPERRDSVLWHLERALIWSKNPNPPFLLNNIAGVYLQQSNPHRALHFILRAIEQPNLPGNLAFNLDLNLLVAHTAMGEHELAQAVYDRIKLQKITPGNHLKLGVAASEHLFLINDYDAYVKDHRWLSTCFESAQEVEGEYAWLYPPHRERLTGDSVHAPASRREWDILRWSLVTRQRLLEALPANEIPADFADSEEIKEVDHRIWLALLLFPFGMLAGWWGRKSPRKHPHSHNNIHPLIQELKLHVEQGAQSSVILEQLNKLDGIWRAKHHEIHRQIKLTDAGLTRVEDQVLELIASGRTSKEIAHVLDLSVSYVYNVRTRLRKKLNVPDELQLEQWIHESTS